MLLQADDIPPCMHAAFSCGAAPVDKKLYVWQAVEDSGVMDSTAMAEASQVASKVSEAVKEAAHTVQGAMSVVCV